MELWNEFEKILFQILNIKGETKASKKNNFKTPDYIDETWQVFDFKLTVNQFNRKDILKYNNQWKSSAIIIHFNEQSENSWDDSIYYEDFLNIKWIDYNSFKEKLNNLNKELKILEWKINLAWVKIKDNANWKINNTIYFTI